MKSFKDLTIEEQIEVINNSYEIARNNFNSFIADDVKNILYSFTDIRNKYNDLKKETDKKIDDIHNVLTNMFNNFINDKRVYAQARNNYLMVLSCFSINDLENTKPYSENLILIYIHTFFQTLYYKIAKYYEKEIDTSINVLMPMLRYGTLFNNTFGQKVEVSYVKYQLEILVQMLNLKKGYDEYFFFEALLEYGSMNAKKKIKFKGFVDKFKGVLSGKRETMYEQIEKLPRRTFKDYLSLLDYSISK